MHPIFGCFFAPCFCKRATPNASTFVVTPAYHGRHFVAPIVFFTFMNYSKGLNRTSFTLVLRPSTSLYHVLPTFERPRRSSLSLTNTPTPVRHIFIERYSSLLLFSALLASYYESIKRKPLRRRIWRWFYFVYWLFN